MPLMSNSTFDVGEYCKCNDRGICIEVAGVPFPVCACDGGFSGVGNYSGVELPDCSKTWETVYPESFTAVRSVNIIFSTIALIYTVLNILYFARGRRQKVMQNFNDMETRQVFISSEVATGRSTYTVLGIFFVWLTIDLIIMIFDPYSFRKNFNYLSFLILSDLAIPMGTFYSNKLIEHMISFAINAVALLKQEEMMKTIKSDYEKKDTVEHILSQNSMVGKIFIIGSIANGVLLILTLTQSSLHYTKNPAFFKFALSFSCFVTIFYFVYVFFLSYLWKRFIMLLPTVLLTKNSPVYRTFQLLYVVSFISATNTIISVVVGYTHPDKYYYWLCLGTTPMKYIATFIALSIFKADHWKDYRYIFVRRSGSSRETTAGTSDNSRNSQGIEIEIVTIDQ